MRSTGIAYGEFGERIAKLTMPLLAMFIAGCATSPKASMAKMGDRRIEYALVNHDSIPIVFENGLGGEFDRAWTKILADLAPDNTTFAYNRPGYGNSDAVATPRDGKHIVDELRALLRSKGLSPPYILVGHSLGGLYMQYFARRYPDEVAALVLVDSTHPDQAKGKGAIENWPLWYRLLLRFSPGVVREELQSVNVTGEAVQSMPEFIGKPVILLSAQDPEEGSSESAEDAKTKRKDLLRLYPGAKQIWVQSGHFIQHDRPEVVIAAIREVLLRQPRKDSENVK